jgi:hypothetical protein
MNHPQRLPLLALALVGMLVGTLGGTADARPRPSRASRFQANKTFGLGVMIGAPTGLSGKYFLTSSTALDFGVGGIDYYRNRRGLHLHMDYLLHPVSLASTAPFELPLYLGIGARLWDFDDSQYNDHAWALGVRAPIGVAFDFNNVPLDIFFELALVVDFFSGYRDTLGADVNGAIGLRYWFE